MAWLPQPQQNAIFDLLEREGTTVADVLDDKGFAQALRSSDERLCRFLSRPDNIEEMFKIAFTDQRECIQRMRQAVTALSTKAQRLQNELLKQEKFFAILNGFPESEFAQSPRSCGHFQRIVDCYVRFRPNDILSQLTSLRAFLVEHMWCLSLRNLFITLVSEYAEPFKVDLQLLRDVVAQMRIANASLIAGALLTIFQTKRQDSLITPLFTSPELVGDLLDVAVNGKCPVMATSMTLKLLNLIMEESDVPPESSAKVKEFGEKYAFEGPVAIVVEAARLFHDRALSLIDRLISNESTFLNELIVSEFGKLTPGQQNEFVNQNGLCDKIMAAMNASERRADGYLIELAETISRIPADKRSGALSEASWNEFVGTKLATLVNLMNTKPVFDDPFGRAADSSSDDDVFRATPAFSRPQNNFDDSESESESESEEDSDSEDSDDLFRAVGKSPDSGDNDILGSSPPDHGLQARPMFSGSDDDLSPPFERDDGLTGD